MGDKRNLEKRWDMSNLEAGEAAGPSLGLWKSQGTTEAEPEHGEEEGEVREGNSEVFSAVAMDTCSPSAGYSLRSQASWVVFSVFTKHGNVLLKHGCGGHRAQPGYTGIFLSPRGRAAPRPNGSGFLQEPKGKSKRSQGTPSSIHTM